MIAEYLKYGEQNARTGKELCEMLSITTRELTKIVEKERREGQPICASTGATPGYFIASNKAEMQKYCDSLRQRAGRIFRTRRACLKTMEKLPELPGEGVKNGS